MKHYKFWQAPIFAFFSTQFYRELGTSAKGVGFLYLLVLLSFGTSVTPIKEFARFQSVLLNQGRSVVEQMPELNIDAGKLSINQPSPYYVSDPQSGTNVLAFDTSGKNLTPSDLNIPMLVTANGILTRTGRGDFETKFAGIQHLHASPQDLMRLLFLASYLVPVLNYVIGLPLAWVAHIVQAFAFSLAGLVLAKTISVDIKYEGILRIACAALGNVILLDAIMQVFPLDIPGYGPMEVAIPNWFLYKFVLAFGFTLFGVGANLSPPSFQSVSDEPEAVSRER